MKTKDNLTPKDLDRLYDALRTLQKYEFVIVNRLVDNAHNVTTFSAVCNAVRQITEETVR